MAIIFHNITVLLYFDQLNAALVNIKDCFQKHLKKSYSNLLTGSA